MEAAWVRRGAGMDRRSRSEGLDALLAEMRALGRQAARGVFARVEVPAAANRGHSRRPTTAPTAPAGHGSQSPAGEFEFQRLGHRDRGRATRPAWTCSIRGRTRRAASPPHDDDASRSTSITLPGDQRRVQAVPRRDATTSPRDDHNFLRDWAGRPLSRRLGNKPVTWVSLEDARAYAAWAGKRLPHEWEWQYAAQGTDGRAVSVGQRVGRRRGSSAGHRPRHAPADRRGRAPAAAPARSASMDLTGNVWQWTDEYVDEHTRAAHSARRQLLPAARLALVLPASLQARPSTASTC